MTDQHTPLSDPTPRQGLAQDQRGAVMVMGIFMAVLLVGMLYYVMGIGETIVYRERMQDAADAGAFAAAVMHARGMNIIALLNLVMAAVLASLVALKVAHDIILAAEIVATMICAACSCPGCCGCCLACPVVPVLEAGREEVAGVIEGVEPIILEIVSVLSEMSGVVRSAYPVAAQFKVIDYGMTTYNEPTELGVMHPIGRNLPVETDDSNLLCEKAGVQAGRFAATVIGLYPVRAFVGTATGALASAFSSRYCGDGADDGYKINDDIELGDNEFQLRVLMRGDPPLDRYEQGVSIAAWGRDDEAATFGVLDEMGRYSFAQAEFYFNAANEDRKEWMWSMRWRARLRRFRSEGLPIPDEMMVH